MQDWYGQTEEGRLDNIETLGEFLLDDNIELQKIEDQHKDWLEEEFTWEEIEQAINEDMR